MKKWSELTKFEKQKNIGIAVVVILVIIIAATTGENKYSSGQQIKSITKVDVKPTETNSTISKWDAYGICCQIAKEKYGKADLGIEDATDMGDDDWIIVGHADIPGKRIHWTGEVKHNLSDDKWQIKGWTDR